MTDENPVLIRRTDSEKRSYLDGFRAGVKLYDDRLSRYLTTEGRSEMKAAREEVDSVATLIENTLDGE